MPVNKSAQVLARKHWCFFFIYSSIEFNTECEEREQKVGYVCEENQVLLHVLVTFWTAKGLFKILLTLFAFSIVVMDK